MPADVRFPEGSVYRVRDGVEENVAVGVAKEPAFVLYPDPAQPEFPALDQRVRVAPDPDAVITSYSIHYTKLYDGSPLKSLPFFANRAS